MCVSGCVTIEQISMIFENKKILNKQFALEFDVFKMAAIISRLNVLVDMLQLPICESFWFMIDFHIHQAVLWRQK